MTPSEYQKFVLAQQGGKAIDFLPLARLTHWGLGLAGESGEVVEHVKKYAFHGRKFDFAYMQRELGDVLFYLTAFCNDLGFTLEDVMQTNIDKLKERWPKGFNK